MVRSIPRPIRLFFAADIALGLLYVANLLAGSPLAKVNRLLDLDGEANLPTWFSSMQWGVAAALAGFVWYQKRSRKAAALPACLTLAVALLLLSADEVAQIHEKLSIGVSGTLGAGQGRFKGMWLPALGVPLLVILGLCLRQMKEAIDEVPGVLRHMAIGLGVFGLGAFGVEPVLNILDMRATAPLVLLEETMEMAGGTFVLWAIYMVAAHEGLLAFRIRREAEVRSTA